MKLDAETVRRAWPHLYKIYLESQSNPLGQAAFWREVADRTAAKGPDYTEEKILRLIG